MRSSNWWTLLRKRSKYQKSISEVALPGGHDFQACRNPLSTQALAAEVHWITVPVCYSVLRVSDRINDFDSRAREFRSHSECWIEIHSKCSTGPSVFCLRAIDNSNIEFCVVKSRPVSKDACEFPAAFEQRGNCLLRSYVCKHTNSTSTNKLPLLGRSRGSRCEA